MSLADKPKVVGGVCEVLDYDIKYMTHFVVEHSLITCGKIINDSDEVSGVSFQMYKKGIEYVLNATRLPRSTIYIALNYLHSYVHKSKLRNFDFDMIYQHVITSLVIGNKFNDDKMFANKTWSTASGVDLKVLNKLEIDFLKRLDYNLNDPSYSSTYDLYDSIFMDIVINLTTKAQSMNYACMASQHVMANSNEYYQPQYSDFQQMNYYPSQNMGNYMNYQNMQHYYNNQPLQQSYVSLSPSFSNYHY